MVEYRRIRGLVSRKLERKVWDCVESPYIIILALLVGILFRVYLIFLRQQPTADEIWAYLLARADLKSLWMGAFSEFHAPFYFIFLKPFVSNISVSLGILEMRFLALFWGICASFAIWKLGTRVLGEKGGVVAFYLSLIAPGMIWVSVYGRYYSFLIFLVTISLWLFLDFLKKKRVKSLIFLALVSTLGAYTHYYFFLFDFTLTAYLLSKREARELFSKWVLAMILVLLLCLPVFYFYFALPKPEITGPPSNDIMKIPAVVITNLVSFESLLFLYFWGNISFYLPVLTVLFFATVMLLYKGRFGKNKRKPLFLYLVAIPALVMLFVSYTWRPFLALGSLSIFSTAILILLAGGLVGRFRYAKVLAAFFWGSLFLSLVFLYQSSLTFRLPMKGFPLVIDNFKKGDVIVNGHFSAYLMSSYYLNPADIYGVFDTKNSAVLAQKAIGYRTVTPDSSFEAKRVWFLESDGINSSGAKEFKSYLLRNYEKTDLFIPSGREDVGLYKIYLFQKK